MRTQAVDAGPASSPARLGRILLTVTQDRGVAGHVWSQSTALVISIRISMYGSNLVVTGVENGFDIIFRSYSHFAAIEWNFLAR